MAGQRLFLHWCDMHDRSDLYFGEFPVTRICKSLGHGDRPWGADGFDATTRLFRDLETAKAAMLHLALVNFADTVSH